MSESAKGSLRGNRKVPKGVKATRGRPLLYDEVKVRKWYTLTPKVINAIKQRAEHQNLTESEALEQLIRTIDYLSIVEKTSS
ncbi:hypothetical protein [Synechocystis salina]|jgi:hypothetical protein|uniref:Ribbon-helix-helix protein CopG domain-containing protein n=1 Tax=Synechocystis salina LEGE 00031 TaxID=1828736 RepID=A0ABR9VUR4_9SYNC|nr:hypothetical protein [Synechocystis salina]MBE9241866.1 hypothetical protein [Synechocystis salina LEGE 00041]MBE9255089.1 hypothetical protein [Synechocystis salina LEGE 00031]